jgi:RNA polymerase sigma-70 factor (ECF subfamily)
MLTATPTANTLPVVSGSTGSGADDEGLVARLRAGDDGALGVAYDRHAEVVFGIARRVSGDVQLAREVTQEVFAHLWEHPDRVELARGSLHTYLVVIAHHRAVDELRRMARRRRAEGRAAAGASREAASTEVGVVDAADRGWHRGRLGTAIGALPEEQRAALVLAYFDGCSYREVAAVLKIPEGTAKSRLRLALAHLRTALAADVEAWGT